MVLVRPARSSDAVPIRDLHVAAIEAFGPEAYDDEQVASWADRENADPELDALDDPDTYIVAAERGRNAAGRGGDAAERSPDLAGFGRLGLGDGEITAIYVHPDHARTGVGSALLAHLEGYARGYGLSSLTLRSSLNAVEFYERAGYERVEAVEYETSGGAVLRCIDMEKAL